MVFYRYLTFFLILGPHLSMEAALKTTKEDPLQMIHIAIGIGLKELTLSGTNLSRVLFHKEDFKNYLGDQSIHFLCKGLPPKKGLLAMVTSPSGLLAWNGVDHTGDFLVIGDPKGQECLLVNRLSLDDYLMTLLPKEMNKDWPKEALKAQAIVSRTYALFKKNERQKHQKHFYDLVNSEADQVSGSLKDKTKSSEEAVLETKGLILVTKDNKVIPTFFHSKCGGKTRLPQNIWNEKVEGIQSVECPYCHEVGKMSWKVSLSQVEFEKILKKAVSKQFRISFSERERIEWKEDEIMDDFILITKGNSPFKVKKNSLREIAGREKIPSNNWKLSVLNQNMILSGEGLGHGVGLCQLGAYRLAQMGRSYKEILQYYFPSLVITHAYE